MIKLIYCVRKRADMDAATFYDYWLHTHGPKVRGVADAIGAKRYVQSHTTAADINEMLVASRGLAPAYDGVTEVWWDSQASFTTAVATEAGQAAMRMLIDDESTFIDFGNSRVFMSEEHEIFG